MVTQRNDRHLAHLDLFPLNNNVLVLPLGLNYGNQTPSSSTPPVDVFHVLVADTTSCEELRALIAHRPALDPVVYPLVVVYNSLDLNRLALGLYHARRPHQLYATLMTRTSTRCRQPT